LQAESFTLLKRGIYDDSAIDVYTNAARDFAFLAPPPSVDYSDYKPRHQALGLSDYKKTRGVIESRFAKIRQVFMATASVLEVGAADGSFLAYLQTQHPDMLLAAIEPDELTQLARRAIAGLKQYATLDAAAAVGLKVDVICLFHVFEHLPDPASWLAAARRLLGPGGRIVIEVPSLDDPLLSLYKSSAYRDFYFQRQHPFVYSAAALRRVLEHNGFAVEVMPYQRYGLENHLTWLVDSRPGGGAELRTIFADCEAGYTSALEGRGLTDSVFAIARMAA
jgi:SAM-dependent methyltransferase